MEATGMSLEGEIKEFARSLGADLVGIAPFDSEYLEHNRASIQAILPGCRSLVVIAKRLNDDAIRCGNLQIAQYDTTCAYGELDSIEYKTALNLKERGFRAVSIPPNMPVDLGSERKGMVGEVNQKCAAVAAGLGTIGVSGLLVSPAFGPCLRLGSILTSADLRPDAVLDDRACTACMECVKNCPAGAIHEDGSLDLNSCMKVSLKHGLPGVVRFGMKSISLKEEELKAHMGSPTLWELWQNLLIGNFNGCFRCMSSCPIGKHKEGLEVA
jgi:epoxyqueuosine reductase